MNYFNDDNHYKTIINGVEYDKYDKFCSYLRDMEQYYINAKNYSGYPQLWDRFYESVDIFDTATDDEKRLRQRFNCRQPFRRERTMTND
jgi:hypothetical protein